MSTDAIPCQQSVNLCQNSGVVGILAREARTTALSLGASLEMADAYAAQFVDRVLMQLGGGQLYFPQAASAKRRAVHAWIRANWRGDNVAELAKGAQLSERRIRQLVAEKVL